MCCPQISVAWAMHTLSRLLRFVMNLLRRCRGDLRSPVLYWHIFLPCQSLATAYFSLFERKVWKRSKPKGKPYGNPVAQTWCNRVFQLPGFCIPNICYAVVTEILCWYGTGDQMGAVSPLCRFNEGYTGGRNSESSPCVSFF